MHGTGLARRKAFALEKYQEDSSRRQTRAVSRMVVGDGRGRYDQGCRMAARRCYADKPVCRCRRPQGPRMDRRADKTFLGEADRLVRNPHYTSAGAPVRLYLLERIAVERTPGSLNAAPSWQSGERYPRHSARLQPRHGRCNQQINLAALTFTCGKIPRLFGNIIIFWLTRCRRADDAKVLNAVAGCRRGVLEMPSRTA